MTEVPEHLLQRSRDRRRALGLETADDAPPVDAPSTAAPPAVAPSAAAAATTAEAPPLPAPVPEPAAPPPPEPPKPWVKAAFDRKRIPYWVAPVLLFLPIWAFIYVGTLEEPTRPEEGLLAEGRTVYVESGCSGCHGATGGGGVGPALSGGEVLVTFPSFADQAAWIVNGSDVTGLGTVYGDPDRPGGPRVVAGGMPTFASLSARDILAVTLFERVEHGGEDPAALELETLEMIADSALLPENFVSGVTAEDVLEIINEVANGENLSPEEAQQLQDSIAGEGIAE